jgi:DNA-directed RNA polymerase subunit RPC12/RpoP
MRPGKRFEVFKRDGFVCMYCGARPPNALLEVDHIVPRAGGGSDDEENLITSCFDCNRGKGARPLGDINRQSLASDRIEEAKERILQAQAYAEVMQAKRDAEESLVDILNEHWAKVFHAVDRDGMWTLPHGYAFPDGPTLRKFMKKLPLEEIIDAMDIAASSTCPPYAKVRYFCAVCWRRIRGEQQ